MKDKSGRTIEYLRLSVTDRCNFRCRYCMGPDGVEKLSHNDILSLEELFEIAAAAVKCGVRKIRFTGGEPLVRRGLPALIKALRSLPGVEELNLTTNGSLLAPAAAELKEAGITRLNISVDTLDAEKFKSITRIGTLDDTLNGIKAVKDVGFQNTKINTVLIGGFNTDEIRDFVLLTRNDPLCVRFIELMPIGECARWDSSHFVSADTVLKACPELKPTESSGVAECYRIPGYAGTVGLIRPMSHRFCASCNRIRVTADGKLKPCLHSSDELPLRGLHGQALLDAIKNGIEAKPQRHYLTENRRSDSARRMDQIGG